MTYSFSYDPTLQLATVTGDTSVDALTIEPVSGYLEYSVNGGAFSSDWSGSTVPASSSVTVSIGLSSGDGSSLTLGTSTGPASDLLATFNVSASSNTLDTLSIDDSSGSTLASSAQPYSIDTGPTGGTISGPGLVVNEQSNAMGGGVNLQGSPVNGNIYNLISMRSGEPVTVAAASGVSNTVNVTNSGSTESIDSALAVTGPATLNLDDSSDLGSSSATLDNHSTNPNASYEVLGLSPSPIEYGPNITVLNISGGSLGNTSGVTFQINNTQVNTTTTITGGSRQNSYLLSNSSEASGLDNLPGAVVIHGGSALNDVVTLDDSTSIFNDTYTVTSTTVGRAVFGGLTYDNNIGTLNLKGESGSNTINVNSTANNVTTNIDGQGGNDTINVNATGTGAALNVTAGSNAASTVNVVADSEPVNIKFDATDFNIVSAVNIGSTGGPGTMTGIQGAIGITDPATLYKLSFHDENDAAGRTWTLNNLDANVGNQATVSLGNGIATTTYRPGDLTSPLTLDGGSGGNTFQVNNTSAYFTTLLNTGTGNDIVNVLATGNSELDINGQNGQDTVNLGGSTGAILGTQGLTGSIYVNNTNGTTALSLDDSQNSVSRTVTLSDAGGTDTIQGLTPGTIDATDSGLGSLTVLGGTGGNNFTVNGTFANANVVNSPTVIDTGIGNDTTTVRATTSGSSLLIDGQSGTDTVLISSGGSVANIAGSVSIANDSGHTALTVDGSADSGDHGAFLSGGATQSTLQNLTPAPIDYNTAQLSSLTVDTGPTGNQNLEVNFGAYNPIPTYSSPGLTFNGGASASSTPNSHSLIFFGTLNSGPFQSEVHKAEDPNAPIKTLNYGSYGFVAANQAASSVNYSGVQQNTDFTPAVNYTFDDFGFFDQSFTATNGQPQLGLATIQFQSTPTPASSSNFATTTLALKQNITFVTPLDLGLVSYGLDGLVNVPTPPASLQSLTINTTTNAQNQVNFIAEPAAVNTSLNGGTNADTSNVSGLGVPTGTNLVLNAGPGQNILTYDAGGLQPYVSPNDGPGDVISIPGHGTVIAIGYQSINVINAAPPTINDGPPQSLTSVEGSAMSNVVVGTFFAPLPGSISGFSTIPAADFTGSISWGDGSESAATIVPDLNISNVYDLVGSHTFLANGNYVVNSQVDFNGATIAAPVNGANVSVQYASSFPVSDNTATAVVTHGTIGVSVLPFLGTEGTTVPSAPIAMFTETGGNQPVSNFSASITITGPDGFSISLPAASITQEGSAALYQVTAPAFVLPWAGSYQVMVSVTDNGGAAPVSSQGSSNVAVAGATLTAGPAIPLGMNTGVPETGVMADFKDGNAIPSASDFSATIDWGDGSPTSIGLVQVTDPGYSVQGTHMYARPGTYATSFVVTDNDGAKITLQGMINVTNPTLVGSTQSFTAAQNVNTGPVVLAKFVDPNMMATAADLKATIATNGWGDGSSAADPLVIQQIGVNPPSSLTNPGAPIFEIIGSHTYVRATSPGSPDALGIVVTTLDGSSTTLTSPVGSGVTVTPAPTAVAGDYDGDGKADVAVYLPSLGAFDIKFSSGAPEAIIPFGIPGVGNSIPAPGDYDHSGKTELAVYVPAYGELIYRPANGGPDVVNVFGSAGAGQSIPAPGDYYGTGQTDIAVYLPASGVLAIKDPTGATVGKMIPFGMAGLGMSIPVPGNYYGTGQTDVAVYMPSSRTFAIQDPTGQTSGEMIPFGMPGDGNSIPMPGDYDGSGKTELAVYLPTLGIFAYRPSNGGPDLYEQFGSIGKGQTLPTSGDFTGVGHDELAAYIPSAQIFAIQVPGNTPGPEVPIGVPGLGQTIPVTVVDQALAQMSSDVSVSAMSISIPDLEFPTIVKKKK